MANVKSIIAAHLSQRQRNINKEVEREDLLGQDRLPANIVRVAGDIKVPDKSGFNWAQEHSSSDDSNPFHVFNDKVQDREGLSIWVGDGRDGRREVLDWRNATIINTPDYNAQKYLPTHGSDHEWPDFKPGPDAINIYPRALTMLRTYPGEAGALTISVSPLRYIKSNAIVLFPGKISLDISASQPASGLALFVGIYLDPDDNTIKTVDGATTSDSPAIIPDSPVFPESAILSANVRLDGDQTILSEVDMSPDIRQILDSSGAIDGTRISKLVSPDGLIDPVLSADNSGDVTLAGTGDLIIPVDLVHAGDPDTTIGFDANKQIFTVGALVAFQLTETGQDLIEIGDVAGGGDWDINFNNGDMFLRGSDGFFGIGTVVPSDKLTVIMPAAVNQEGITIEAVSASGVGSQPGLRFNDNVSAEIANIYANVGDTSLRLRNNVIDAVTIDVSGNVGIGTNSPGAKLHIDQSDGAAAQPVVFFDQADASEQMRQFETTVGAGNAIEAAGSKLLTVTHFIKDTLPGGLTRYTPYGTISTTGPKFSRTETVTTQGLGANPDVFGFGSYEFSATDANLTQASTTQTFGTANVSYAAHAFAVTGGAGTVDTGVIGLRVNGTSINDQGTRTTSDTETIIADITTASLNDYQETAKKWLGQVTYELFTVSGSPTTFSLDFNYGRAKYDDWFNTDFTITDVQATGFAGANDAAFDIKLMHHQASGWTYSAAAFTPITAANTVASLATDHSTDDQLLSGEHVSWKRDNLSEVIDGTGSEGFLLFVSSSANNAVEYLNLTIGVIF